jgi:hypothetical protein
MKISMRIGVSAMLVGMVVLSGDLAFAQLGGYAPGVNPSNPQDLTNRSNPQSLTVPGGNNPQDLVRSPSGPRGVSPANPTNLGGGSPSYSSSLGYTHIDQPIQKSTKKFAPRKHRVTTPQGR